MEDECADRPASSDYGLRVRTVIVLTVFKSALLNFKVIQQKQVAMISTLVGFGEVWRKVPVVIGIRHHRLVVVVIMIAFI